MKLVLIGPVHPYRGGIAQHTACLARALSADGHEVVVISFKRQYPRWLYPGSSDIDPSQKFIHIPAEYLLDPVSPRTWAVACDRVAKFSPAHVIIQWWTTFWSFAYAQIASKLNKQHSPVTFIVHNMLPHENKAWDPLLAKMALSRGNALIAHNPRERAYLARMLPDIPVTLCKFPEYPPFVSESVSKEDARAHLGLPQDGTVLLFFGLVRPYKGLGVLIDALANLSTNGITPYLIIAGEFWQDKQRYLDQITAHRLNERVVILDRYLPNEEADLCFMASDLLVAPYTGGTQSAVAAQALGYRLPMVITERIADGVPEEYRPYMYIVRENDAVALAVGIESAIKDISEDERVAPIIDDYWQKLVSIIIQNSG